MDTNVNYTIVGAFVIVLMTAIVLTIIWLSSGFSVVPYTEYVIYSQESVSGLNQDASVEYNGVNVGSVEKIELNEADPHLVTVLLKIKTSTPITRGTVATLTSRGVTGVAFIALKDAGADSKPLLAEEGQPYPIIPTAPSLFMRFDLAFTKLTKNFQTIADSIHELLDKENLASIKSSLQHLDRLSGNLTKSSGQLTPLLKYSISSLKTLNNQTLPATYRLLENLNDASRALNDVSVELKQNPSILIRGAAPAPLGPGERR